MPDATITSTASTFGTISGTFAADQSTITGTVSSLITGTLSGSVGVPGPQGPQGAEGPQGPQGQQGEPGEGVPTGGTTGQYLVKLSNADYATEWASLSLAGYATESWVSTNFYPASNPSGFLNQTTGYNYFTNYFYPLTGNPGGYATQAWVTGQNYITISALSPYVLQTQLNYQLAGYALQSWVTDRFYPLTGNPSGFLTTASLSGYATESWVTAQSYLTTSAAASTYAVTARGLPSSGTAGQVLTKVNGTDYNATWATLIPGDRYLTTSTTSLTVGNGTKSLTVGTGLSYSPQQDVTIAYDGTAHMHAVVTSYNSTTGAMVVDVQNHSGSGTYADWTVNVGGTVPLASIAWGDITGTLGDQSDLATALNAKLDTTTAASTYYPLTGNPSSFLVASDLTGYALESWVNSQGFLTSSSLSGYATESWVNSQGFTKTDTPAYFSSVVAEDSPGSSNYRGALSPFYLQFVYGTGPDRSVKYGIDGIQFEDGTTLNSTNGLATQSWVTAQSYLTSSALYGYATESWVSAGFYPLTGNPSSFLVSADLAGYATESWVSSQGYITSAALSGLTDVTLTYPANGEVLKYDSATSKWINGTITSSVAWGGITGTLSDQTDLNSALSAKLDTTTAASTYQTLAGMSSYLTSSSASTTYAAKAGATFTGKVNTVLSSTSSAGFNLPHGAAPTTPTNGDVWTTTGGLFAYINGATHQYPSLSSGNTFTGTNTFSGVILTFGNSTTTNSTVNISTGANAAGANKNINIGTGGASGSGATIVIGPAAATNSISIGVSTAVSTVNIASGVTASGATKTVLIGTSSAAGSNTNITIGSTAGTSTTTLQGTTNGVTAAVDTNSTALATTAYVIGQGYLKSATASSTYAPIASPSLTGTPLSTTASAGTFTTQIATTEYALKGDLDSCMHKVVNDDWSSSTSGTGASTAQNADLKSVYGPTGIGYARMSQGLQLTSVGAVQDDSIDWSKKVYFSGRVMMRRGTTANLIYRVNLGDNFNSGDPVQRCVALKCTPNSTALQLQVHNGTTLTTVNSSFTPTIGLTFDFLIVSNAGTVTLYVNRSQVATTTAGPTNRAGSYYYNAMTICCENTDGTNGYAEMSLVNQSAYFTP